MEPLQLLYGQSQGLYKITQVHDKPENLEGFEEDQDSSSYHTWIMPAAEFAGLWER